jgi:hypothetical protein
MFDIYVENYKNSVLNILDYWHSKMAGQSDRLDELEDDADKLRENKTPSDDDRRKLAELKKRSDEHRKVVNDVTASVAVKLKAIKLDQKVKKEDVMKLRQWMMVNIKSKAYPLQLADRDVDIDIDLKTFQLKRCLIAFKNLPGA